MAVAAHRDQTMKWIHALTCLVLLASLASGRALASEILAIVNAANPVSLTPGQVADLYAGRESRFPDGRRAVVIDQNDRQEAKRAFYERALGLSLAEVRAEQARLLFSQRAAPPREAFSSKEVAVLVGNQADAIGYIEAQYLLDTHRVVARWPK